MKASLSAEVEACRVTDGQYASIAADGLSGTFLVRFRNDETVRLVASDGSGCQIEGARWEHVSASLEDRWPTWDEMDKIRHIFWRPEETVIQIHAPSRMKVNYHPFCLHLWNPITYCIPLPPRKAIMINCKPSWHECLK